MSIYQQRAHCVRGQTQTNTHMHMKNGKDNHINMTGNIHLRDRMRSLGNICMVEGTFSRIHHRWAHEAFFQLKQIVRAGKTKTKRIK